MKYIYPCVLEPEDDGGFSVFFPDVVGANTCGNTREEALALAEDSLVAALGAHFKLRRNLPLPSLVQPGQESVPLPLVVAAKMALCSAMTERRVSKVGLGEILGISESAVRRLCDPDHRSHIGQVEKALRALGIRLLVEAEQIDA